MFSSSRQLEIVRPASPRSAKNWALRVGLPAFGLVFASIGIASPTLARSNSSFDGDWSVVIQTRGGDCTPMLRYPVAISNGVVSNAGESPVAVSGRVTPAGAVRVTVQAGGSSANGTGRLSMTSGGGIWRGQGTDGVCTGTWQAVRRTSGAEVMNGRGPIYNYAPNVGRRYDPGYSGR
jgi:hypothetical protein